MSARRLGARVSTAGALALAFAAAVPTAASSGGTDPLPRRVFLGANFAAAPEGARVESIVPGGSAARVGLRPGDVVVAVDGRPVTDVQGAVGAVGRARAGDRLSLSVLRDGRPQALSGRVAARPLETYPGARVRYGEIQFRGGRLRDILVEPIGAERPAIVFMLQGYTCASIEGTDPAGEYAQLAGAFAKAGLAYYRVEKPGVGDSRGGPACEEIDFATELDAFRTAYAHLTDRLGYEPDRIFMLGHSLGGVQAPLLAAERPPRGVAVFGTVLRNWAEYMHDVDTLQAFMIRGADPVEEYEAAEKRHDLFRMFFEDRRAPADIAKARPEFADAMRSGFGWDGGERAYGRSYRFLQDLAHLPLMRAWSDARTRVLAMYGATDEVALFPTDHLLIADVVNHYRPGSAAFVEIPDTMHGMDVVGDRQAFRARNVEAGRMVAGPFNPEVSKRLVAWIWDSLGAAPVRSLPGPRFDTGSSDRKRTAPPGA